MKLKEFRKKMQKSMFTTAEAQVVAFSDNPKLMNLQLHQWKKSGEMIHIKRGLFMFADYKPDMAEVAKNLCYPCYFSLEYVLNFHGIMPEAIFSYTLITPKKPRRFKTPLGNFIYQSIKKDAFTGYDSRTLLAEPEKALVDYFYLNSSHLKERDDFWEESRLNGADLDFKKVFRYAKLFKSKKLIALLIDFQNYAKTH